MLTSLSHPIEINTLCPTVLLNMQQSDPAVWDGMLFCSACPQPLRRMIMHSMR